MKHNYVKAKALYEKYYNMVCDPWTMGDTEYQQERRIFMRAVTHNIKEDIKLYTDYIREEKHYVCEPYPDAKSKVWDFDLMREYDALVEEIENFEN